MENAKAPTQSVLKLFQLIDYLSNSVSPVRLQQIADDTQMSQSTVLRYLCTLIQLGYAFQDPISERYALSWRICKIGENIKSHSSLRMLSGTIASELSAELCLGVGIVIENNGSCMYLDCIYEPSTVGQTLQRIGGCTPMHSTSSGKLLLSRYNSETIDQIIADHGLPALTPRTITNREDLMAEIERSKKRGYAIDDEECEDGLRCVSVPLYDYHNQIAAAICCFGSTSKVTEETIQSFILPRLREAASKISFRMGSTMPRT